MNSPACSSPQAWRGHKSWFVFLIGMVTFTGLLTTYIPTVRAASDSGYVGPSYSGATGSPSGSKPESKLWWNDGFWWASMFDTGSTDYHIFKLDLATQTWVDTGTVLDTRSNSRADALWDATTQKLYIASHVFTESSVPGSSGDAAKLWRFSYNTATDTYVSDAGFPTTINTAKTETLVIDKDSTGKLWATWVQQTTPTSGVYKVYVNRTLNGDVGWGTPFGLPTSGSTVANDDIASVVAFDGNKIGVMWSNQIDSTMNFAIHVDGQADTTWLGRGIAYDGPDNADDHINLKSLQTDAQGRVFAAIKTSRTGSTDPLVMLLVFNRTTGTWTNVVFGTVADSHTRPIVLLDQTNNRVHMFATADQNGGSIYEKTTSLDAPSFATGRGTPFIEEAATPGTSGDLNNGTSTKQPVSCVTGMVVLATNDTTRRYWHNYAPIPGCGSSPTATPTVTATTPGAATATAIPTATQAPTATSASTPTPTTPPAGTTLAFLPLIDTYVSQASPTSSYGTSTQIQSVGGSSAKQAFLRFTVSGLPTGASVGSAKLRLVVTNDSTSGGVFNGVSDTSWAENITWNTKPLVDGPQLANIGAVALNAVVEVDVTAVIRGNGTYSFAISLPSANTNTLGYASREASTAGNRPQLIVSTQ